MLATEGHGAGTQGTSTGTSNGTMPGGTSTGTGGEGDADNEISGGTPSVSTVSLDGPVASFAEATLDLASTALVSGGALVGDDVLTLTADLADVVQSSVQSSADDVGHAPILAVSLRSEHIALTVLSGGFASSTPSTMPAPAMPAPPGATVTPMPPSSPLPPVSIPLQLAPCGTLSTCQSESAVRDALVSLTPSFVNGGILLALLGVDPHGGAATPAAAASFAGVISVRRLPNRLDDGPDVQPPARRLLINEDSPFEEEVDYAGGSSTSFAFNASMPVQGGGNCTSSPFASLLFGWSDSGDAACLGGTCCEGACHCDGGYYGEYCEVHIDCSRWAVNRSTWDNRTCALVGVPSPTHQWANCTCSASEGDYTLRSDALWHRWLPPSNVQLTLENLEMLSVRLRSSDGVIGYLLVSGLLTCWLLASLCALHQDCRHVYVRQVPSWMWAPTTYSLRWRFMHHLRRKHSIWRLFTVVPGLSTLTRVQLVTTLFNQLLLAFTLTVVWYGQPRCYIEQTVVAGTFSFCITLVGSSLGRILFSRANRTAWDRRDLTNRHRRKAIELQRTAKPDVRASMAVVRASVAGARDSMAGVRDSMAGGKHRRRAKISVRGSLQQADSWENAPSARCDDDRSPGHQATRMVVARVSGAADRYSIELGDVKAPPAPSAHPPPPTSKLEALVGVAGGVVAGAYGIFDELKGDGPSAPPSPPETPWADTAELPVPVASPPSKQGSLLVDSGAGVTPSRLDANRDGSISASEALAVYSRSSCASRARGRVSEVQPQQLHAVDEMGEEIAAEAEPPVPEAEPVAAEVAAAQLQRPIGDQPLLARLDAEAQPRGSVHATRRVRVSAYGQLIGEDEEAAEQRTSRVSLAGAAAISRARAAKASLVSKASCKSWSIVRRASASSAALMRPGAAAQGERQQLTSSRGQLGGVTSGAEAQGVAEAEGEEEVAGEEEEGDDSRGAADHQSAQKDVTVARRQRARIRGLLRDKRIIHLWLPARVLHRAQGDWVLIVEPTTHKEGGAGTEARATKPTHLLVHSLGVSMLSLLPASCCCCAARLCGCCTDAASTVLVRIEPSDVPKSLRSVLTASALLPMLRGGGPLAGTPAPGGAFTGLKLLAWFFNVSVLVYGATFLLFAYLVIMQEAMATQPGWTSNVLASYALSCTLSFILSDMAVSAIVAASPMRARRAESPTNYFCGYLASLCELEEVMLQ